MSKQTMKAAWNRMRGEGYLSASSGKPTRVAFRQSEAYFRAFIRHFFEERHSAFTDLCQTAGFIFTPLLVEGFCRMDSNALPALCHSVEQADADDLMELYSCILQKLENPLAMNLFWEASLFLGFPFLQKDPSDLYDIQMARHTLHQVISRGNSQGREKLSASLTEFQTAALGNAVRYINRHIKPLPQEEQIPFTWRIYREHPQICYSLALRLLHEIYLGEYRDLSFLPSYEKLANTYDVSLSTIRRTVQAINRLGAVCSINGKGTRIYAPDERCGLPDFTSPAVRRNFAYFFQAFEILAFTCREVVCSTLTALLPDEKLKLAKTLEGYLHSGQCGLTLGCLLNCLASCAPLRGIREVYGRINGLLLWGIR